MMEWIAVAAGGALGAVCRLALSQRWNGEFPFGTLIANWLGSLLLGACVGWEAEPWLALMVGTGFCGGFTTFSTLNTELYQLTKRRAKLAAVYAAGTFVPGVALAWAGWQGMRLILS